MFKFPLQNPLQFIFSDVIIFSQQETRTCFKKINLKSGILVKLLF